MEDSRLMQSMLLDFYGDLLTEKQCECCSMYFNEDLSLSEIAEQRGISRQGVWDNIRHGEAALRETEEKTGLIRRFERTRSGLYELLEMLSALPQEDSRMLEVKVREIIDSL